MTMISVDEGRELDVEDTGGDGPVLVFQHGTPGSKVGVRRIAKGAAQVGLRVVAWSRPGYGASTRQPGRDVAAVAVDAAAVLDTLGIERCVVAGWSGGGPHALGIAAGLPQRVAGVTTIAGAAPYEVDVPADWDFLAGMGADNITEFNAALAGETTLRPLLDSERSGLSEVDPAGLVRSMDTLLPDVDRALLTDDYGRDVIAAFAEGLRLGVDGWVDDDLAFTRPWGFDLSTLEVPAFCWQGSVDLMVPFSHGQWLADHVPGVTAHLLQGEGHLSVGDGALTDILGELRDTIA